MQHIQFAFDRIRSNVLGAYWDSHLWACNIRPVTGCWRVCSSVAKREGWQVSIDSRYINYWQVQQVLYLGSIMVDPRYSTYGYLQQVLYLGSFRCQPETRTLNSQIVLCIEDTICVIAGQIVMVAMAVFIPYYSLCRVLHQSRENYSQSQSILSAIMILGAAEARVGWSGNGLVA